jgi:hypothetical protein
MTKIVNRISKNKMHRPPAPPRKLRTEFQTTKCKDGFPKFENPKLNHAPPHPPTIFWEPVVETFCTKPSLKLWGGAGGTGTIGSKIDTKFANFVILDFPYLLSIADAVSTCSMDA